MRRVGQARKRDANEAEIVAALRAFGARVLHISGPGAPDLLVGFRGRWYPMEVKTAKGTFTKLQAEALVNGYEPFAVVRTVDDALGAIGATRTAQRPPTARKQPRGPLGARREGA